MADEYIRLDTTIMGIDGLINEAPTGSQARALFCAKDMIYDQQRYVSEMKPVKRGRWKQVSTQTDEYNNHLYECTVCRSTDRHNINVDVPYCWHCGAKMEE